MEPPTTTKYSGFSSPSSLDYLQPSPIRGQLDPIVDSKSEAWRYLQCTDTPDELRVQLPPTTAAYYARLLAAELTELNRTDQIVWARILEIRHLKERMLRKCHRLARELAVRDPSPVNTSSFKTFTAPIDFRLKEMEKWFLQHSHKFGPKKQRPKENFVVGSNYYDRCSEFAVATSAEKRESSSNYLRSPRTKLARVMSHSEEIDKYKTAPTQKLQRQLSETSQMLEVQGSSKYESQVENSPHHQVTIREIRSGISLSEVAVRPPEISSISNFPPTLSPLPPPFLPPPPASPPSTSRESSIRYQPTGHIKGRSPEPRIQPRKSEDQRRKRVSPDSSESSDKSTIISNDNLYEELSPTPSLRGKRSILRFSSERTDELPKTVSWATDRDWENQASKYAAAARDVQLAGEELELAAEARQRDVENLDTLQKSVSQMISRLRAETEGLFKVEEAIQTQQALIQASTEQLGRKQIQHRAKVDDLLTQTDTALSMLGLKRLQTLHDS